MGNIAIIPARGGSKGIKRKNLQIVGDLPLVLRSVRHGLTCERFDLVAVDSDDDEILEVCRKFSAEICCWERPSTLGSDEVKTCAVLRHRIEASDLTSQWITLLQPTIPFRHKTRVIEALDLLSSSSSWCDSLCGLTPVEGFHPKRMNRVLPGGGIRPYEGFTWNFEPRQHLEPLYLRSGWIYICRTSLLKEGSDLLGERPVGFVNKGLEQINIDSESELEFARWKAACQK